MEESINKIIAIGETGVCTVEELLFFLPNYPINRGGEFIFQCGFIRFSKISNIEQFIKGLHLIELKYREVNCDRFGFGSPSKTSTLISRLYKKNKELSSSLTEWVKLNGGNYYINREGGQMEEDITNKQISLFDRESENVLRIREEIKLLNELVLKKNVT